MSSCESEGDFIGSTIIKRTFGRTTISKFSQNTQLSGISQEIDLEVSCYPESPSSLKSSKVYLAAMTDLQYRLRESEKENSFLKENQQELEEQLKLQILQCDQGVLLFRQLEKCLKDKLLDLEEELRQRSGQIARNEENESQLLKKQIQIESQEVLLAKYKNQNQILEAEIMEYKINNQTFHQSSNQGVGLILFHKQEFKQLYHDIVQAIQINQDELELLTDLYEHNVKDVQNQQILNQIQEIIFEKHQKLIDLSQKEEDLLLKI